MSLISVIWTLFRSSGQWDKFDLDDILRKGDQLFKSLGRFRYLRIEALSQELENKTGEISAGVYLLFLAETVNSVQQIWTGALLNCQQLHFGLNLGK